MKRKSFTLLGCLVVLMLSSIVVAQMDAVAEAWIASLPEDGYHVIRGPHEMHERWKGAWEVWELKYMIVGLIAMYRLAGDRRLIDTARRIAPAPPSGPAPERAPPRSSRRR